MLVIVTAEFRMFNSISLSDFMKIVEDYAQRKVDEKLKERNEEIVRNMDEKGIKKEDIADLAKVSPEFVEKTLAK